ncbi:MAG: primosomal protein N' [Anaerolineales bacterium]
MPEFAEVAVNLPPVHGTFDYHVPPRLRSTIAVGHLVTVPFGTRRVQGVVIRLPAQPAVSETRPIEDLVDPQPVLTETQIELARWMAKTYHAALIDALTLMIPPGLSQQADSLYHLLAPEYEPGNDIQRRILNLLLQRGDLRGRQLAHALPRRHWKAAAEALVQRGALARSSVLDPPRIRPKSVRNARLSVAPEEARRRVVEIGRSGSQADERRQAMVEMLIDEGEALDVTWLYAETGGTLADLHNLEDNDLIVLSESEVWRDPLEELDFVPALPPTLTKDQERAWEPIRFAIEGRRSSAFLLQGVTGSGKTELYLRAVAAAIASGRTALVLVPEISLTPQTVRRFLARFPGQVGLVHSELSEGERYDTWRRSRLGKLKVVVGPRSALFTPLPAIGLIVLDESHDESYKEAARSPRYHAREVALAYARRLGATVIFGSATPDIGTRFRAERGGLQLLELPRRILGHRERLATQSARLGIADRYQDAGGEARSIELPPVRVVDMRLELKVGNRSIFSRALSEALETTLEAGEQAILFLNRRGSETYIFCRDCGWVARCPRCDRSLTQHRDPPRLVCHHCGYSTAAITVCPQCGGRRVRHFGAGTQRIQSEVEQSFPGARTLRWDRDATRSKGAHDVILAHFAAHRADILIGTQMLAKGLDIPLVTLVGVVSADTGLNLPDYRAAERTFQLLTQVAGRAGRGLLGGRVILQTYQPDHYAIQAAAKHDYERFYHQELRLRRELAYPPFRRLARLVYRHTSSRRAEREAERLASVLKASAREAGTAVDLIGPAPCFFERVRGLYRWHLILRGSDPAGAIPETLPEGWAVDIDPVSLL